MMTIPTYLAVSPIEGAGIGCFASEFIPKDTVIWRFNPCIDQVYTDAIVKTFSEVEQAFLFRYCYRQHGLLILCADNSRHINHSAQANTVGLDQGYEVLASQDIEAGEEILADYGDLGNTSEDRAYNLIELSSYTV